MRPDIVYTLASSFASLLEAKLAMLRARVGVEGTKADLGVSVSVVT